jgi:hypothetical protein
MGRMKAYWSRARAQVVRVGLLLGLLVLSGAAIGLAASVPLRYVKFDESTATRVDQAALAGQVPVEQALVSAGDLSSSWSPGDPALGAFGLIGTDVCGEKIKLPTQLSGRQTAVFTNSTDNTTVISQALRVDRWQTARTYISDVQRALSECSEFYQSFPNGTKSKVKIKDPSGTAPIADDYVAATFVNEDGQSVQEWSMFAVGDVIVSVQHIGPTRPAPTFLNDVEQKVLVRIDPKDFAPGGIATETTLAPSDTAVESPGDTSQTGAADETGADTGVTTVPTTAPTSAPTTAPTTTARSGSRTSGSRTTTTTG